MELSAQIEGILAAVISVCIQLLEMIGVVIIMIAAVRAVIGYFRKQKGMKLVFAENMALALEFKLGGEILRTVVVREWNEIAIVGAIIALRGFLNFLIHWEISEENKLHPAPVPDAAAGRSEP